MPDELGGPIDGHCDPAFAGVREAFAANFARGDEVGAAVAVYVAGRPVVDLWGGVADHKTGRPWLADTPVLTFSCTKAVTAAAALRLAERGAVDLAAPVRTWWPEFAAAGKADATGEHLLSHQAGLPAFDDPLTAADARDPAALADRLAAQAPLWAPGSDHGYHALTYGWLAGELVRRHAGRTVGAYVADEIAGDLELHLAADDALIAKTARLTAKRLTGPASGGGGGAAKPGTPRLKGPAAEMMAAAADPASLMNRAEGNPAPGPGGYNNPELLRGGWPAAGLIATARGLAGFYRELLAGRILAPETLRDAVRPRVSGPDRVLKVDSTFGLGFMRPSSVFAIPPAGRDSAFGHTGASGAIGVGDLGSGMAMAYVTNRVGDEVSGGMRAVHLVNAVYRALG
ncbi:MAG TPA: serine hydrolase domain-containing protein [Streptosporangiaceae bacterium]|jgi:CubicO group peptidase (beta-lactamase class C family)